MGCIHPKFQFSYEINYKNKLILMVKIKYLEYKWKFAKSTEIKKTKYNTQSKNWRTTTNGLPTLANKWRI